MATVQNKKANNQVSIPLQSGFIPGYLIHPGKMIIIKKSETYNVNKTNAADY